MIDYIALFSMMRVGHVTNISAGAGTEAKGEKIDRCDNGAGVSRGQNRRTD